MSYQVLIDVEVKNADHGHHPHWNAVRQLLAYERPSTAMRQVAAPGVAQRDCRLDGRRDRNPPENAPHIGPQPHRNRHHYHVHDDETDHRECRGALAPLDHQQVLQRRHQQHQRRVEPQQAKVGLQRVVREQKLRAQTQHNRQQSRHRQQCHRLSQELCVAAGAKPREEVGERARNPQQQERLRRGVEQHQLLVTAILVLRQQSHQRDRNH